MDYLKLAELTGKIAKTLIEEGAKPNEMIVSCQMVATMVEKTVLMENLAEAMAANMRKLVDNNSSKQTLQ